jgi:hypothetical protein
LVAPRRAGGDGGAEGFLAGLEALVGAVDHVTEVFGVGLACFRAGGIELIVDGGQPAGDLVAGGVRCPMGQWWVDLRVHLR